MVSQSGFYCALVLNICSSVSLIMLNKTLFQTYDWKYASCLTTFHFLINYLCCEVFICGGFMKRKWLPWQEAVPMAATWCGSILFANFSLRSNSTGFYQAMKLLTAPILVIWQFVLFRIRTDKRERNALIPLILGVGLITVTDISTTMLGTVWAVLQLLCAAAVQTWVKTKQKKHAMEPTQLLHNNAFCCFALLAPMAPLIDYANTGHWVFNESYPLPFCGMLLLSGIFAMLLNMACFMIIGYKGPIAFQVVGYLKTVLVFIGGYLLFGDGFPPVKIAGLCVAIPGLYWYTRVKQKVDAEKAGSQNYQELELATATKLDAIAEEDEGEGYSDEEAAERGARAVRDTLRLSSDSSEEEGDFI